MAPLTDVELARYRGHTITATAAGEPVHGILVGRAEGEWLVISTDSHTIERHPHLTVNPDVNETRICGCCGTRLGCQCPRCAEGDTPDSYQDMWKDDE